MEFISVLMFSKTSTEMNDFQRTIAEGIVNKEIVTIHDFMRLYCNLTEIPDTFSSHHFSLNGASQHFERQRTAYKYEDHESTVELVYDFMDTIKLFDEHGLVRLEPKRYNRISETGLLRIAPTPQIPTSGIDIDMVDRIKDYVNIIIIAKSALKELLEAPTETKNPIGFQIGS